MKPSRLLYFAYGSNLNMEQMWNRCSGSYTVCNATLENYRLEFKSPFKRHGVATIEKDKLQSVPGSLWSINRKDLAALDRYEGFPTLYDRINVTVTTGNGDKIQAMTYRICHPYAKPTKPSSVYYNCIADGYKDHGINEEILKEFLQKQTIRIPMTI